MRLYDAYCLSKMSFDEGKVIYSPTESQIKLFTIININNLFTTILK